MHDIAQQSADYRRVETALEYLALNFRRQPDLAEIAAAAHLSEYHFQRLFSRWVGVSPKKFLQSLTLDEAKRRLAASASVFEASHQLGLSGASRLHDLFVRAEALSPGEFKRRGAGLQIEYGYHPTPFGETLLLATPRGLSGLAFVEPAGRDAALADMCARLPRAEYRAAPAATAGYAQSLCQRLAGRGGRGGVDGGDDGGSGLRLLLAGTPFQLQVWRALLRVPAGKCISYSQIATHLGRPDALRAVGSAVGRNPISWLIPCHRVLRRDGLLGGYHWGEARKLALLGWEASGPPAVPHDGQLPPG